MKPHDMPMVFVHLGSGIPRHVAANARMAAAMSSHPVLLVTDATLDRTDLGSVVRIPITPSWYSTAMIRAFRSRSQLDPTFRGGFWIAAVERFFVLLALMKTHGLGAVTHVESDVMLLGPDRLIQGLSRIQAGAALPYPHARFLIPSVCYFSGVDELGAICEWLIEAADTRSEMELLAEYAHHAAGDLALLPTEAVFESASGDWRDGAPTIAPEVIGGIVDANVMGQWLLGLDPRNFSGPGWNRYVNPNSSLNPADLRFRLDGARMYVRRDGEAPGSSVEVEVLALHVHSKVHPRLERGDLMPRVIRNAAAGRRTLITPGVPHLLRPGRTLLPSRWAARMRAARFRGL